MDGADIGGAVGTLVLRHKVTSVGMRFAVYDFIGLLPRSGVLSVLSL